MNIKYIGIVLLTSIIKFNSYETDVIETEIQLNSEQTEYWIENGTVYEFNEGILKTNVIDKEYTEQIVELTEEDREELRKTVLGEARGEGFIGMAIVMQTIKDTMIEENCSVTEVVKNHGYAGKFTDEVDEKTEKRYESAIRFIFEEGKYIVKHKLKYFYAFKRCSSTFHETRTLIIQYGGHKFFY